jgi:hypothetical protein
MGCPTCLPLLLLVGASSARAGEPIVLSVEVANGESFTAAEVRDVVEREVGGTWLRAGDADAAAKHDLLVVDVEDGKASLLFQPRAGQARQRLVALPPSAADGLRLIAWVAVNLVRDQTGAAPASDGEGPVPDALASADSAEARRQRRAILFLDLDPDPFDRPRWFRDLDPFDQPRSLPAARPNPFAGPSRHPLVSRRRQEIDTSAPILTLSAFFGATEEWGIRSEYPFAQTRAGELVQVEAQYSLRSVGFGMAFDIWGQDMKRMATAVFTAREWQWERLRSGGNLGFGVAGSDGFMPYVRANAAFGFMVLPQFEVSFRFSLHVGPRNVEESQLAYLLGARFFL